MEAEGRKLRMTGLFIAVCSPVCIVFGLCWPPLHFLLDNCIKNSFEWKLPFTWKKISNDCALPGFTGSMLRKGQGIFFFFPFQKRSVFIFL